MSGELASEPADALVIHNPSAGTRNPERLRARIAERLGRRGVRAEVWTTSDARAARQLARRAVTEGIPRVLVAGGDGTVSEVAGELAGRETVLGILPFGTGNQLAFYLGLPLALERALDVALGPSIRAMDVGSIDGRTFTAIAGAGIDADVIAGADRKVKRWVGKLAYLASGLGAALRMRPATIRVQVDGAEWEGRGLGILLANVPRLRVPLLPGGLTIAPDASAEDGILDACVLTAHDLPGLAHEVWRGLVSNGGHGSGLRYFSGRTIRVETDPPLAVEVDGDLAGFTPIQATLQPAALRVAAPPVGSRVGALTRPAAAG